MVPVDAAEAPGVLARHVAGVLERELRTRSAPERIAMVNALLQRIAAPPDHVLEGPQQLYAIRPEPSLAIDRFTTCPEIALAEAALLTNGRGEPPLNAELASPCGHHQHLCRCDATAGARRARPALRCRGEGGPRGTLDPAACEGVAVRRRTGCGVEPSFLGDGVRLAEVLPDANQERTVSLGLTGNRDRLAEAAVKSAVTWELTVFHGEAS